MRLQNSSGPVSEAMLTWQLGRPGLHALAHSSTAVAVVSTAVHQALCRAPSTDSEYKVVRQLQLLLPAPTNSAPPPPPPP